MKSYAITGNSINWFNSYLKGRKQKVVIKIILQHIVKYCRCSTMPSPWPSLIYYLFK